MQDASCVWEPISGSSLSLFLRWDCQEMPTTITLLSSHDHWCIHKVFVICIGILLSWISHFLPCFSEVLCEINLLFFWFNVKMISISKKTFIQPYTITFISFVHIFVTYKCICYFDVISCLLTQYVVDCYPFSIWCVCSRRVPFPSGVTSTVAFVRECCSVPVLMNMT